MIKRLSVAFLAVSAVCLASVAGSGRALGQKGPEKGVKIVKTDSGLRYQDLKVGDGAAAKKGNFVEVHYTGWLASNGKKFDSSVDRKKPFRFPLGNRKVIAAWDEGVAGMKIGGKRRLLVPAKLGYGEEGFPPVIPGNADLVFDVELLRILK
jgi:FKBP-type peptidyl-prolyl cis-trans isomerase